MNLYLYGDQAAATVARVTPLWQAWFQERFPMPNEVRRLMLVVSLAVSLVLYLLRRFS